MSDLEEPVLYAYGEILVEDFGDYIQISGRDWAKIKQWVIPIMKQGDKKDGNTEAGNSENKTYPKRSSSGSWEH